ncbi:uncharacterized protein K452DRAFT_107902 [Aplosporella prunicola CBS 121167]|uniref:RING-type E3 ubiquitin transferase n=1 Tax=Aplosporella prunicola CBS 121167 TaxID=1176127 RepID=A0A6A6BR45_9PEZI|nr:uncharacterized protein K452DRAFT_107902 [Aplosporella prunicola CBS 121167]KAF2146238.1 hypothetical protein K452DRAFT_107902 [Aplosporella prunicola CBS 121167]
MRLLRLLLSLVSCVLAITLLLYITLPTASTDLSDGPVEQGKKKGRLRAFFSFSAPSLFPPSAVISLTDDNSTFFLARPAAFGPPLPARGLSGQLWTGSGFGGDNLAHGGLTAGAEGELGCSDVPGWSEGGGHGGTDAHPDIASILASKNAPNTGSTAGPSRRSVVGGPAAVAAESKDGVKAVKDDGTDETELEVWDSRANARRLSKGGKELPQHADIQSLQESAEITGKVVLLSRGGCGFLEKVKWAQRRGGVAVIVGDDIRGGPLVTMYARGDTSNITIPALFTSHTTAHLLSSLIPSGEFIEGLASENIAKLGLGNGSKASKSGKTEKSRPTFTQAISSPTFSPAGRTPKEPFSGSKVHGDSTKSERPGWISSFLGIFGTGSDRHATGGESRRPPSSGNIDWILVENWEEEETVTSSAKPTSKSATKAKSTPNHTLRTSSKPFGDDFVIGVQDWRDPDLLPQQSKPTNSGSSPESSNKQPSGTSEPQGGHVLPGSGEYADPRSKHYRNDDGSFTKDKASNGGGKGWLGNISWRKHDQKDGEMNEEAIPTPRVYGKARTSSLTTKYASSYTPHAAAASMPKGQDRHEGLWVTLTPTSMSSSPFFDTLLVLVVSPLITLTVVYAMLLLRSRIRRRRWRAPKSIVERLPVRTYHTLSSHSSNSSNSLVATPNPAAASSRTPLLQGNSSAHASTSRPRPRSRTASEIPSRRDRSTSPTTAADEEKGESGLAAWRRKYGGRQKECVVCLEEYVDGVSRVMSLPCGHEFHAECITPWLTTRRRTCPICKGDVVRSLSNEQEGGSVASASSSTTSSFSTHGSPAPSSTFSAAAAHEDLHAAPRLVEETEESLYEDDDGGDDLERGGDDHTGEEHTGFGAWIRDGWAEVTDWWWGGNSNGRGRRRSRRGEEAREDEDDELLDRDR